MPLPLRHDTESQFLGSRNHAHPGLVNVSAVRREWRSNGLSEKQKYATCLVAVLTPSSVNIGLPVRAHRGDALCLMDDELKRDTTLGARKINVEQIDIGVAGQWLARCSRLHAGSECTVVQTEELCSIRLIDVEERRIVSYPREHCDYVALSYVWGDTEAQSYRKYDAVGKLPATIEDAISYTKALQKRFLWVDSLCIDQSDESDKKDQIARMWSIYRGAYITLIALSGTSANAGLSRASRPSTLAGLMPTLSQQMWVATWGQRAWTFQEALLSPRCLFIGDHGLYFDCNAMQCSESLDECRSWGHNLSCSSNTSGDPFTVWMISQVGSGALRSSDSPGNKFLHWGAKTLLYSYRSMRYESDAINAYAGVLQRLQATTYPKGFLWGMPIEDLDWALAWRSQWPPERRLDFPSWSWAGWKGGIHTGYFLDLTKHRRIPVDLEIRSCSEDQKDAIFTSTSTQAGDRENCLIVLDDPIHEAGLVVPKTGPMSSTYYLAAEASEYLLIDAVCFHFLPDFSNPQSGIRISGQHETFSFHLGTAQSFLAIMSVDRLITAQVSEEQTFILLCRHRVAGLVVHHMLHVLWQEEDAVAERGTVMEIYLHFDQLDKLAKLKPRRRRLLLR
ncbi:hypothetical protein LTR09_005559 [Extremus antarcticus]|uniref:Heterokaryon incompatibility domain-containing protein n=1 Tax=Extremus antarcticus TaxID=702011 RepID=A0AAJ0DG18_9PEZI|nr:hypothetical protein LTR09_005559 [Extremus antarcticus]